MWKNPFLLACTCVLLFLGLTVPPASSQEANSSSELTDGEKGAFPEQTPQETAFPLRAEATPSAPEPLLANFPFIPSLVQVTAPGRVRLDDANLERIYQYQLNNGIRNFTTFATYLINRSQHAVEQGNSEEGLRLARFARRMAPDLPHPYWALARAYRARSVGDVFNVIREWLAGYVAATRYFRSLLLLTGNVASALLFAFLLTIITVSFIYVIKYFGLLAHDIGDFCSLRESLLPRYILAGTVIVLPVLIGLGCIVIVSWWLLCLAVYFTRKEKHVMLVVFLVLILLPFVFRNGASLILASQPGLVDTLQRANGEDWSLEDEATLEERLLSNPSDLNVLFTLGLLKKRAGKYEESVQYYSRLIELSPSPAKAVGNLANVYLAQGELEQAELTYKKALDLNDKVASFHYNLYRTYLELYKFLEAQKKQELYVATRLDPNLIEYQEKILNPSIPNRMAIDGTLSLGQLWDITFSYSKECEDLATVLWNLFFKGIPLKYGAFFFFVLCVCVSFVFFYDLQKEFSCLCKKCGQPIKRSRLVRPESFAEICQPCMTIFVDEKKVDTPIKEKKRMQVERYEKRGNLIWKVFTYLCPGSGQLWLGFPGFSFFILLILFSFIFKVLFWEGVIRDSLSPCYSNSVFGMFVFAVCFLAFYIFTVRDSYRKKQNSGSYLQFLRAVRTQNQEQKMEAKDTARDDTGREQG